MLTDIAAQHKNKFDEISGKLTQWHSQDVEPRWPLHFVLPGLVNKARLFEAVIRYIRRGISRWQRAICKR